MRVLMLSHGRTIDDQPDFHASFTRAVADGKLGGFKNIPYVGYHEKGLWSQFLDEVIKCNNEFCPDVVFFQFFHGSEVECVGSCLQMLRKSKKHPLIFVSSGDQFDARLFGMWRRRPEKAFVELATRADAIFSTEMGAFSDFLVRRGAKNVVFLPHGLSVAHFCDALTADSQKTEYDVLMLGSVGISKLRPFATFKHAAERIWDARRLQACFGDKFGLFGNGWRFVRSHGGVAFRDQVKVFQTAKVVVDARPPFSEVYYASDRPFFVSGAGVPLVMQRTPRFEKVLREDLDVYFYDKPKDLIPTCERVLALPEDVRRKRAEAAKTFVLERHTVAQRIDTILSTAEAILLCREGKVSVDEAARHLRLWHFGPNIDLEVERRYALVNWVG